MIRIGHRQAKNRLFSVIGSLLVILLLSFIPVRVAIAKTLAPYPQAIFTLGGGFEREVFTAQFANLHPDLEIWISKGAPPSITQKIFRASKVSLNRVHIDRRAVDTVTNFTSLVNDFQVRKFNHLYLITSDFHMRRAKAIAMLILGSRGIAFTPISIPTNKPNESFLRILRDIIRVFIWIICGRTGASSNPHIPA